MRGKLGWLAIGILVGVGVAALGWQRARLDLQRAELELLRDTRREAERLRADNDRLRLAQLTPEMQERLRNDRAARASLRAQLETLRKQADDAERTAAEQKAAVAERFAVDVAMPAAEWKNMGSATPAATLETALWAAAGGDVRAFADQLVLDNEAKAAARALLASLPDETRKQFGTPEQLIAFLSIKDVPTGEAKVREWTGSDRWRSVELALRGPDGAGKEIRLMLVRSATREDWKLGVTSAAVAKYAATLKDNSSAAGAK